MCSWNSGLTINFNNQKYFSERGLFDLLTKKTNVEHLRYPIIHLKGEDIEIAMTHGQQYGEEYYSFVNGQNTTQGGTHQAAFREAVVRTIKEFLWQGFRCFGYPRIHRSCYCHKDTGTGV